MLKSNNNIAYISYLRIIAMILVVYYHCICCFTPAWKYDDIQQVDFFSVSGKVLNNIHIPLFLLISGYLYGLFVAKGKYEDNWAFIKNKGKRLGLPFVFWSIIAWFFLSKKSYFMFVVNGASYLWFLGSLFVIFLLIIPLKPLLLKNKKIYVDLCVEAFFLLLSIMTLYIPSNPGLILYEAISYFYIFLGGALLSKYIARISWSKSLSLVFLVIALSLLYLTCQFNLVKGSVHLQKVFSLICVCLLLICAQRFKMPPLSKTMQILDRNCMGIYILHYIPILLLLKNETVRLTFDTYPIIHLVLFLVIFIGSFILSELIRKNKYTRMLIGG